MALVDLRAGTVDADCTPRSPESIRDVAALCAIVITCMRQDVNYNALYSAHLLPGKLRTLDAENYQINNEEAIV